MFVIIKKEKYMEKPDSSLLFRQPMYADKKQWKQFLSIILEDFYNHFISKQF